MAKKKPAKADKKNKSKVRETFTQAFNIAVANAGFSIDELAQLSGMSRSQLYDFKRGTKAATTDSIDKIAPHLKVAPEDFLKPGAVASRPGKSKAKKAGSSQQKASKPASTKKPGKKQPGAKLIAKPKKAAKPATKKRKPKASPKSAAPMESSSVVDESHAASGEAPVMTDLDTPEGMSAANAEA